MPKRPEQIGDIRKQKKQLIMDTALKLFAENGFHATSISQIAKKASISKGLSYNYFTSKDDILKEIMEQGFHKMWDNLDINHDGILSEEEFIFFIHENFRLVKENIHYWRLFFSLLLQPRVTETYASNYKQQGEHIFKMFFEFIISSGSKEPDSAMMAVSSMMEGAFLYLVTVPDLFPTDKLEDAVVKNCLKIIKEQ